MIVDYKSCTYIKKKDIVAFLLAYEVFFFWY